MGSTFNSPQLITSKVNPAVPAKNDEGVKTWTRHLCSCRPKGFTRVFQMGGVGPLRCTKCLGTNLKAVTCTRTRRKATR